MKNMDRVIKRINLRTNNNDLKGAMDLIKSSYEGLKYIDNYMCLNDNAKVLMKNYEATMHRKITKDGLLVIQHINALCKDFDIISVRSLLKMHSLLVLDPENSVHLTNEAKIMLMTMGYHVGGTLSVEKE